MAANNNMKQQINAILESEEKNSGINQSTQDKELNQQYLDIIGDAARNKDASDAQVIVEATNNFIDQNKEILGDKAEEVVQIIQNNMQRDLRENTKGEMQAVVNTNQDVKDFPQPPARKPPPLPVPDTPPTPKSPQQQQQKSSVKKKVKDQIPESVKDVAKSIGKELGEFKSSVKTTAKGIKNKIDKGLGR